MRRIAPIALVLLATLAGASPALATPSQDTFGVTQARTDAPALDGDGLVVAVVDSGVDDTHPALAGKVLHSEDLVGVEHEPCPDLGHGTWVAGVIAGRGTPSLDAGVAPEADVVSIDVVDSCNRSSIERIAEGIQWAVDHRATYGIDVINLSIGDPAIGGPEIDAAEAAVQHAVQAGITVVAAAGNKRGLSNIVSPGSAEEALTVGAMADQFTTADLGGPGFAPLLFSSGGPTAAAVLKPDIMGPTAHVAAKPGIPEGEPGSGTSGAAAFTSGVALLMLDADPTLTPAALKAKVMATAKDWGRPGPDEDYGAGRLDAYAALQAAGAPLAAPPAELAHRTLAGRAANGEPGTHEVVVTGGGLPLVATLVPDPGDRLPATAAADLTLRVTGPGGADVTAPALDRRRTAVVAHPDPGTYTLTVGAPGAPNAYVIDVSGALGAAPAAPALTLDTPAAATNDPTPRFEGGTAGTAGVTARIYRNGVQVRSLWALPAGGRWAAEPVAGLPPGTYEIGAGQGGLATTARTARATFTIDTTRPDTTIDRDGATFTLGASEPASRFECSLDGGPFTVCASPYTPAVAAGDHTVDVRAVDLAGNVDATPATVTWNVPAPPVDDNPSPPPPVDPGPAPDTDDPALGLGSPLPRGIAALRGRGVSVAFRCDEACTIRAELTITAKLARRHKLAKRLAAANAAMTGAGTVTLKLKPSRAVQKRLKRVKSLTAKLTVVATDAAGNESRLSRSLRLR